MIPRKIIGRSLLSALAILPLLATAAGCGSTTTDSSPISTPSSEPASSSPTTTVENKMIDVDPAPYLRYGAYIFSVPTAHTSRTCALVNKAVVCNGKPGADVPDITVEPFPPGPPSAVQLDASGISWSIFEGIPPAPAQLEAGMRITVSGVSCEVDSSNTLHCSAGDNGFDISGDDAAITVRGTVKQRPEAGTKNHTTSAKAKPSSSSKATDNYVTTDELNYSPTWCGVAAPNETAVYIAKGRVGCLTAQRLIESYRSRYKEGTGNFMYVQIGEWTCFSPTIHRSRELGAEIFGKNHEVAEGCSSKTGQMIVTDKSMISHRR